MPHTACLHSCCSRTVLTHRLSFSLHPSSRVFVSSLSPSDDPDRRRRGEKAAPPPPRAHHQKLGRVPVYSELYSGSSFTDLVELGIPRPDSQIWWSWSSAKHPHNTHLDTSSLSNTGDLWLAEYDMMPMAIVCQCCSQHSIVSSNTELIKVLKTCKMADQEHAPTSRKRVAGTQINKDNPEPDDDSPEQEMGTFKKASEEVMASRRIVKVRRQQPSSAPSSNPFSAIRFSPSDSSVQASIPASEPQPSDVMTANVKDCCSSEKADGGSNGSGEDALSAMGKITDFNEVAEIQKDESALKEPDAKNKSNDPTEASSQPVETNDKAEGTGDGPGEDKVVVEEPKEDNSRAFEAEGETTKGDPEEKKGENETGDEDKINKDDAEKKGGDESETKDGSPEEQKDADNKGQSSSPPPLFSFKNLSSGQNAFTGLAGTGFSSSSFSFGPASKESSTVPLFGIKSDGSSFPSFNIGATNNGSSSPALATAAEAPKKFAMPEGPVETGEENEKAVFTADSALYEYLDGGWKERGKGELKLNTPVSGGERGRLIMRAKGNYRLILNARLYEDMSLKDMDKKGVTFACMNSIGESQSCLTTFALKFKDTGIREDFKAAVATHKARKVLDALKTPENSPKASDD